MTLTKKTLDLYGGSYIIFDPDLIYSTALMVKKSGTEFDLVLSSPVGRQVQHDIVTGRLIFETIDAAIITDVDPEKVDVLIKN